jgi:transposase
VHTPNLCVQPQRRTTRATPDDTRARFISHILASPGKSVNSAAVIFGIPKSTAHDILRRYEETGQAAQTKRGGARSTKLTHQAIQALLDWVDNEADITLRTAKERLLSGFGISVSLKTISSALTKSGFTLKLLRTIPVSRNSPEVICARRTYANTFMSDTPIDRRNIIWVDETGFNLHLRRKYGRAMAGLRANVVVANNRGINISICAAMSEEGFLYHKIHRGAYNGVIFCAFLKGLFERLHEIGRGACWVVLDNVRFHHSAIVAECADQFGHQLVFLPPYSPMLNPIESLFGKWKNSVCTRNVVFTHETLLENIESARHSIRVDDCLGWIRDMNRNLALSLQNHPFD